MITRDNGIASVRCDECGRRYPRTAPIRDIRGLAARIRADGWRCFFGWPTSLSIDWPDGPRRWRHACASCCATFAFQKRERVY